MRIYLIKETNKRAASVTTIIGAMSNKPLLIPWACKEMANYLYGQLEKSPTWTSKEVWSMFPEAKKAHQAIAKKSMIIGTNTHKAIEDYILHKTKPDFNRYPDIVNPFKAFLKFKKEYNPIFRAIEVSVYRDDEYPYAGTIDCLCEIDGLLYSLDWKTSNNLFDDYKYQLALYRHTDENGISGTMAVRLDKETGQFEVKDYSDTYEDDRDAALAMVKAFHIMNKEEIKTSKIYKTI